MGKPRPIEERFWEKVDKRGPDECWNWTASRAEGYGQIGYQGRPRRAHQIAWELTVGPRTPGLVIDHLCFNKLCQNTAHMEEVTQGENARRGRVLRTPQKRKTHCPKGHPYSGENLLLTKQGYSYCRECNRANALRYVRQKRAERRLAD